MANHYLRQFYATRRRLKAGLIIAGGLAGAVGGLALTVLGKIVAGAPAATAANYLWNVAVFGALGAAIAPLITWNEMRRVPLWRAVVEPLAAGLVGAGIGVMLGSGAAFLILAPLGVGAAYWRLARAYPGSSNRDFVALQSPEHK